jgi:hypothetical protein
MGEISETTMTMHQEQKKKKKGRPSLLDLQKRSLKEQQQQNSNSFNLSANPSRRATCRNSDPDRPECISGVEDDDERKEKKHKLLLGLNPHPHYTTVSPNSLSFGSSPSGSDSNADIEDPEAVIKRRKISAVHLGTDAITVMITNLFNE